MSQIRSELTEKQRHLLRKLSTGEKSVSELASEIGVPPIEIVQLSEILKENILLQDRSREAELAFQRKGSIERALKFKRAISILLFAIFAGVAILAGVYGFSMLAFSSVLIGVLALLRSLDAHSHLYEVRRRSARQLVPRLSRLSPTQGHRMKSPPVYQRLCLLSKWMTHILDRILLKIA